MGKNLHYFLNFCWILLVKGISSPLPLPLSPVPSEGVNRPFFRQQPLSVASVVAGETAVIHCEAVGGPNLVLSWFRTPLESDTPITEVCTPTQYPSHWGQYPNTPVTEVSTLIPSHWGQYPNTPVIGVYPNTPVTEVDLSTPIPQSLKSVPKYTITEVNTPIPQSLKQYPNTQSLSKYPNTPVTEAVPQYLNTPVTGVSTSIPQVGVVVVVLVTRNTPVKELMTNVSVATAFFSSHILH